MLNVSTHIEVGNLHPRHPDVFIRAMRCCLPCFTVVKRIQLSMRYRVAETAVFVNRHFY